MKREKIGKIIAVIGIISVLMFSLVLPASASVGANADNQSYSLNSQFPLNSLTVNSMAYGFDPDDDDPPLYYFDNVTYDIDVPRSITVDSLLTNQLIWYKNNPSESADNAYFFHTSDTITSSFYSELYWNEISGVKYRVYNELTYYNKWIPQADMNVNNPLLPMITTFNSSTYNGNFKGFEFAADKQDSFVFEFSDFLVQTKDDKRPYIQFDKNNFPLSISSYKCWVNYEYDIVTVIEEGGDSVLNYQHVSQTVTPDSWDKYQFVYVLPYSSSTRVISNVRVTVNIRDLNKEFTWVPSNFQYIQPFNRENEIDAFEYLDGFNTIEKWHDVSDITGWLGSTVSNFFDIELFPGLRLSYVLGVIIALPLTIWFLKLVAGG